jgi:intracellular multiplication protein IcmD
VSAPNGVVSTVYSSFTNLSKLITAISYLAGVVFSIGSILKFKQHKDNPPRVPITDSVMLAVIAAILLLLGWIISHWPLA